MQSADVAFELQYIRFWSEKRPSRFVKKSFVTRACKFKLVENDYN